jgi:protein involved in polysaccharide export with SLBB domain
MLRVRIALLLVWLVAAAALTGCSTSGGQITLFPEGHKLIEPAKVLREVSGPPPGLGRELNKKPAEPYIVEPGDVLLVQPAGLGSTIRLPGDQPILPDGTIKLGKYGPLQVMGKTVEQIEIEINDLIKPKTEDDRIVVRLVSRESKVYYVLGEVNAPGAFQLKGRETVLDALVAAGGLTSNASRRKIILSKPTPPDNCRIVLPVNYYAIVQLGDTMTNYQITAGDRVYVPSRSCMENLKNLFGDKDCVPPAVPCFPDGEHPPDTALPPPYPPHGSVPFAPPKPEPAARVLPPPVPSTVKTPPEPANGNTGAELGNPVPAP